MTLDKIDRSLFESVGILGVSKRSVIVYYNDKKFLQGILSDGNCEVLGYYPFVNAVALRTNYAQIFDLAQNIEVNYITKVATTQILVNNARRIINVDLLHNAGICGNGINIAVIDTGCYPHLDFVLGHNRIVKFVDLINEKNYPYDDNGHGTFVAGVLCGNGLVSQRKYRGIAPQSGLIVLKALKNDGQTQAYKVLEAMQWVYTNCEKYNIRVVCMPGNNAP